ncbi:MAG: CAP domain-containing protein [Planctomycetota bacterium]
MAVNEERLHRGMPPLQVEAHLAEIARSHTFDMAEHRRMSHRGSDRRTVADRATVRGLSWQRVAENVARNRGYSDTAGRAVFDWMSSKGHRRNILDASFTHTGIGVVKGKDDYYYFTQVFMLPTSE